jgi:hypothetical protein
VLVWALVLALALFRGVGTRRLVGLRQLLPMWLLAAQPLPQRYGRGKWLELLLHEQPLRVQWRW